MPPSRDPERYRRQVAGLAANNPRLAAKLDAGELPGFKGPLEGTEHLDPEAAAAAPTPDPPPAPAPAPVPAAPPPPARAAPPPGPQVEVGDYGEPPRERPADPPVDDEPTDPGDPGGDEGDPAPPRRGLLGELAAGFRGELEL